MNDVPDIFASMAMVPPAVSAEAAEAIARTHWGIDARAAPIRGERDRNFHLRAVDGREFVLRIANPMEDAAFRHMQIDALRHLERAVLGFAVPRCVALPDGSLEYLLRDADRGEFHVRMYTWVPGLPFHDARRSVAQRTAYGAALAHLQLALADFSHAGSAHPVSWDLKHFVRLREIAFSIKHDEARRVAQTLIDEFDSVIAPMMPELRRQVVHNDATRMNVLVDPQDHDRIAGFIDFGDIAETPVVFDVAITALSQPGADMDAADAVAHFVRGFHAVRPLTREEAGLLPLLVACRIAMGMTLASWHRHMQPDNLHYARPKESFADALALIDQFRTSAMARAVRSACGFG
jgi:Ser/Thr protein kinase RdoA (MazF antagonist)